MCKCRVEGLVIKAKIENIPHPTPTPTPAMVGDWYDWGCSVLGCPGNNIGKYQDCNWSWDNCATGLKCAMDTKDKSGNHIEELRFQCMRRCDVAGEENC